MVGQFKDDRLQQITGYWYAEKIVLSGAAGGAVTQTPEQTYNLAAGSSGNQHCLYSFDSSRVSRYGTTTRTKQKGVKYVVKVL